MKKAKQKATQKSNVSKALPEEAVLAGKITSFSWKSVLPLLPLLPLLLVLGVVPWIVRAAVIPLDDLTQRFWPQEVNLDFFSYYKSRALYVLTLLAAWALLSRVLIRKQKLVRHWSQAAVLGLMILTVLSTALSDYPSLAVRGFPDRYEGLLTWGAYFVLFLVTFQLLTKPTYYKPLFYTFIGSATGLAVFGLFQYLGMDFFQTNVGRLIIVPSVYAAIRETLVFQFGANTIYATLYNTNYVGSYFAMAFPLSWIFVLKAKTRKSFILYSALSVVLFAALLGSRSRAGWVGGIVAFIVFLVVMRKELVKSWKPLVSLVVLIGVVYVAMNSLAQNELSQRMTLGGMVASPGNQAVLEDVFLNHEQVVLTTTHNSLTIMYDESDNSLLLFDTNMDPLSYSYDSDGTEAVILSIDDPLYSTFNLRFANSVLEVRQPGWFIPLVYTDDGFRLLNFDATPIEVVPPATFGFEGRERMGSGRGYIFSRSIPMLRNTLLLGYGPDMFPYYFPQNDVIGKAVYLANPHALVDKPHNLYLQIGINQGVLALILYLVLVGGYTLQSMIYFYKRSVLTEFTEQLALGIMLAVIGYSVAGLFNDSVVSVAPVFWVLLAVGIRLNHELQVAAN